MKFIVSLILIVTLLGNYANSQVRNGVAIKKPNIIFIITDDLGYGDVGVYFQKQRAKNNDPSKPWTSTPNLDKMASQGAMLMHHYCAAPVCAPSRASILTGLSQGHANVRDNQFDKDLADNYTMGNVMQKAGYATAAIGKWGLQGDKRWSKDGDKWPAHPLNRGFDYYYGYMRHNDGHEHYPKEGVYEGRKEVWENRTEVSEGLDKCYTGDLWTAAAKKWIIQHKKSKQGAEPFFMYLAYDIPHAVLELPTQPYPAGGGLHGGMQWIGKPGHMINTATGTPDTWTHPDYANATYDDDNDKATPEVPWPDTYKRYATSTRRIDDGVGDLLKLLADLNIDSNTLVVFTSDNGPSIESYLPAPHVPYRANFFNSFGPFDGIKRDVLEGGERMPVIVRWPGYIPAQKVINTPSISYDWLPTFTAAAGLPAPVITDGVSLLPSLTGKAIQQESLVYIEYFMGGKSPGYKEFAPANRNRQRSQMQMIRFGDLVGLRYDIKSAEDDFGIYNVVQDTHQANNLAVNGTMTDMQQKMKEKVLQVHSVDVTAPRPYDTAAIPATKVSKVVPGVLWKAFNGRFPWLPDVRTLTPVDSGNNSKPDIQVIKQSGHDIYLFEGYIKVPEDGDYTFYLSAGSKAFLRIHEAAILDADYGYVAGSIKESTIKLKAGLHPFKIYFARKPDLQNSLDFSWKGPSFAKASVPPTAFYR
jgi:arylsulfatase A-like enzyme